MFGRHWRDYERLCTKHLGGNMIIRLEIDNSTEEEVLGVEVLAIWVVEDVEAIANLEQSTCGIEK
jgi:hypothetical protein